MESSSQTGEVAEPLEEARVVVGRLFLLAAERAGSRALLCQHLGIAPSELQRYLARASLPPVEIVLRAVDLLIGDDALKSISARTWRALFLPYQGFDD